MDTYDGILQRMREKYRVQTGHWPDDASDIGIRLKVLAGELVAAFKELDWLKSQMFPTTAAGEYLDLHAAQRGLTRGSGTKATGRVSFRLPYALSYDVVVPAGTVVSTTGNEPVRFTTTSTATITAGVTSAVANIEALEPGIGGNVAAQRISLIVTPVAGVTSVTNENATDGGYEPEIDEHLRRRILDSYVNIPNGTNKAYYEREALAVNGVAAVGVIPMLRGPGTVDVFVSGAGGAATPALLEQVRERLRTAREINVDVQVSRLSFVPVDITMMMKVRDGYDFGEVRSECVAAIEDYFSLLGGGESVYLSDIGECVAHVDGVLNYSFVTALSHDTPIPADHAAVCGTITITERE